MKEEFNFEECPRDKDMWPYIILALHKFGGTAKKKQVSDELSQLFDLTDEILEQTTKTGAPRFEERVHLAGLDLIQTGYIYRPSRGSWSLTKKGREVIKDIESRETEDLETFRNKIHKEKNEIIKNRNNKKQESKTVDADEPEATDDSDIEEDSFTKDLEKIRKLDPYAFERLCSRILQAYGYEDVDVTKRSKDGGIDGVGYLSINLVRFKVVFQAKRYASNNKIDSTTVNALAGSKGGEGAEKAILITTSDFTKEARKRALKLGIDLINGNELIQLMYHKEIGYKKTLDEKFLEDL